MAKDHSGSPKLYQLESKRKRVTWIIGVSGLCILFYILGAWQNGRRPMPSAEVYTRVGCDHDTTSSSSSLSSGILSSSVDPAPPNYKIPFKWPQSRDYAWFGNIPHKELSIEKAVQNWVQVEGDRLRFPGGGTMFPNGADAYIDDISELVPLTSGAIRTAIDTGF